jgi:tetratricopeptide (TPR) repeat protein
MIAEAMEVSTVLEGSIQRADDQLRISATLVDPFRGRSGAVIWSATYDHSHTTSLPFAIQDRIVRSIVEGLRIKLEDDPDRQFVQRYTQSPEAYDCYLKGRYAVKQRGVALEKAKSWFELALLYDSPTGSLDDSAMAPAYVGLADTYILQGFYGLAPIRPAIEKARRYVERTLQIDERLAEAYATLGFTELMACNATEAAEAFDRALQLNDRYVPAIQWYSSYFNAIGSYEEAVDLARQAIEVDTASYYTHAVSAWQLAFYFPKETIAVVNEILQHQPDFALAHFIKAFALLNTQQAEAAIESIQAAVELSGGFAFYQSTLALAYARAGKRNEALQTLEDLRGATTTGPWQFACMAAAFLELGDKERCYAVLEQCLAETYGFPWLMNPGFLDALHNEPRFIDIVNRTGLLKYNPTTRQFEVNNESLERKVDH